MCEAERRNKMALHILETKWGCGFIDIGEMQRLLRGDEPDTCCELETTETQISHTND